MQRAGRNGSEGAAACLASAQFCRQSTLTARAGTARNERYVAWTYSRLLARRTRLGALFAMRT
jgi:hypothetical protein